MNMTLDDKTANKMLWLSEGGSKVCRRTEEVCPVLDGPERYEYSPQVRANELMPSFTGPRFTSRPRVL